MYALCKYMRLMTVNKKQLAVDVFKTMDGVQVIEM